MLRDLLPRIREHAEIFLLGAGREGEEFFGKSGVHILLNYRHARAAATARARRAGRGPDRCRISRETFSYTLSELTTSRHSGDRDPARRARRTHRAMASTGFHVAAGCADANRRTHRAIAQPIARGSMRVRATLGARRRTVRRSDGVATTRPFLAGARTQLLATHGSAKRTSTARLAQTRAARNRPARTRAANALRRTIAEQQKTNCVAPRRMGFRSRYAAQARGQIDQKPRIGCRRTHAHGRCASTTN